MLIMYIIHWDDLEALFTVFSDLYCKRILLAFESVWLKVCKTLKVFILSHFSGCETIKFFLSPVYCRKLFIKKVLKFGALQLCIRALGSNT